MANVEYARLPDGQELGMENLTIISDFMSHFGFSVI